MSHTLTTESLNQGLSLSALMSVVAGVPPEVALGALAGAVIFVTSAVEYPIKRRLLLAFISFFCGLLFYKPTATLLIGFSSVFPASPQICLRKGLRTQQGRLFLQSLLLVSVLAVSPFWKSTRPDPGRKDDDRSDLLLILNAAICGGIAIRVLLFRRDGSRHRWWGGWLAYLLIVVAASVPIRTFYGYYVSADWSEVIIKAVFWLLSSRQRERGANFQDNEVPAWTLNNSSVQLASATC